MAPRSRNAHSDLLEVLALLRRQDFVDLGVCGFELGANLRLNAARHRIDTTMVLIDDALNVGLLLRREMQFAVEVFDDTSRRETRGRTRWKQAVSSEKIEAIAGNADEHPADEDGDH